MKKTLKIILYIAVPFIIFLFTLFAGRYTVTPDEVFRIIGSFLQGGDNNTAQVTQECWTIVIQFRLPRAIAAMLVGAALSVSGGAYQCTFRNPLVSPGILGVCAGAGFGASLSIVLDCPSAMRYVMAFAFGLIAVALSRWIAGIFNTVPTVMLVLGGVIVTAIFNALISLIKYTADPATQLPAIVFWLMGSLADVSFSTLWAAIPTAAGIIILLCSSWQINVLAMGDREARSLGTNVARARAFVIIGASLAAAGAVCMSGVVGWIGLIIPHIARMLVGHDARKLLPVSLSLGAGFMLVVDVICRSVSASELPLGIITALIGAPFFVFLLKKTKGGSTL